MNGRVAAATLTIVITVAALASVPLLGQTGRAASPKTPWGEPDLQGMWDTRTRAPFERPKEFGTKEFMTEAEVKDRLSRGLDVSADSDDEDVAGNLEKQDEQRAASADAPDDGRPGLRIQG